MLSMAKELLLYVLIQNSDITFWYHLDKLSSQLFFCYSLNNTGIGSKLVSLLYGDRSFSGSARPSA